MSIASATSKSGPYAGNGSQTAFTFSFYTLAAADLKVVSTTSINGTPTDTTLTLGANYTVTLNSDQTASPGGTVTVTPAPAVGTSITVLRNISATQGAVIPNQGGFYPKVIEGALDKLTMLSQQMQEQLSRCVQFSVGAVTVTIADIVAQATSAASSAASALASALSASSSATAAGNSATSAAASAATAASFAPLPSQSAATAGKFPQSQGASGVVVWTTVGITNINTTLNASATLSSAYTYVPLQMNALGQSVTAADMTSVQPGGPVYILDNSLGKFPVGFRDNTGTLIMAVAAGGTMYCSLKANGSAAGVWSVTGTGLEPGLITIDATFSSTYQSTALAPYVALDSNTSIHFASLASGFAAFVVDNLGKVISTPVTVDATASSVPKQCFKIDATHAIVFFGASTGNLSAAVVTLTGSSPSLSLSVGTAASAGANTGIGLEDFITAPKIAQLDTGLFVVSWSTAMGSGNTSVMAAQVSGTTVTFGAKADLNSVASINVQDCTQIYKLTTTTALAVFVTGSSTPYTLNAAVVSVSGTTCTVGTPATGGNASLYGGFRVYPACVLSSTKALIQSDNNNNGTVQVQAATISGTTVTLGTPTIIETGISASAWSYVHANATRYNPHLLGLSSSTALLWYQDGITGISREVILTESGGAISAGTKLYGGVSIANSGGLGMGYLFPQGTNEFLSVVERNTQGNGFACAVVPCKISGTTISVGAGKSVDIQTNPDALSLTRTGAGKYVITGSQTVNAWNGFEVMTTNGDYVSYLGKIAAPFLYNPNTIPQATPANNRIVAIGSVRSGSTVGSATYQLRLLNVEVIA